MERVNLNVPEGVRASLRALAGRRGLTEGEVARALIVDALRRAEAEEFYDAVAAAQTQETQRAHLAVVAAFETWRG